MAIQDDFVINYPNKVFYYNGGFTNGIPDSTYTANQLYSWLMNVYDEPVQMDNLEPMEGKTDVNYEIINRWFTDPTSMKSLTGGAMKTNGWTFNATADRDGHYGITELDYSDDGSPTEGNDGYTDLGTVLTGGGSGATGILLWADTTNSKLYVRNTNGTQFQNAEAVTGTGWNIDTNATSGFESGEHLWANVYTIGSIEPDTDIYIYQGKPGDTYDPTPNKLTSWWADGHIDVLVKVMEHNNYFDSGYATVYARQFSATYSHFEANLSGGGRNPAPLSAGEDLNSQTGYRTISTGAWSGPFTDGEIITGGTSGAKGIYMGGTVDTSIQYGLVGKDLTDFQSGEVITGEDSTETATSSSGPSNYGPALLSDVTISFGATTEDINNGNGSRKYSVRIDPSDNPIEEVYERLQYVTRRGSTDQFGTGASYDENGEAYYGNQVRLYVTETVAWTEGDLLTGGSSGATGVIVAYHDDGGTGQLILCQVRGTFSTETVTDEGSGTGTVTTVESIAPVPAAPFGTFAGGKFFGAPGVCLTTANLAAGDEQAYQLVDDLGVTQQPPNTVSVSVTGTKTGDRVAVFRLQGDGLPIDKAEYGATVQSPGATTIVADSSITGDTPTAGYVRVIDDDNSNKREARLRYTSYTSATFTLATSVTGSATSGSSGDTLIDTGADFGGADDVRVGDVIRDTTGGGWGYVVSIDSTQQLTTQAADGETLSWAPSDGYDTNVLPFTTTTSDDIYVPFIDAVRIADGDETNQLVWSATIYISVRLRQKGIKPFIQDTTIPSGGRSVAAIRTTDEVVT
ncbi:MAG: hypothetical protein AMS18_08155 [Gemmatimonas sp. SG8_17]|nr:MAG: hypothetical protein AMS18_08155 [Gemmatimonas sp. SG8_17]